MLDQQQDKGRIIIDEKMENKIMKLKFRENKIKKEEK